MDLKRIDDRGQEASREPVSEAVFGREYNEALVHQVLIAYQANARSANRAQKSRHEVSHSTKKPWRQKGTGRARAGMSSSPLWRGGGRVFPNSADEDFAHKLNRKMYRAGMRAILSQLVREDRLAVVDEMTVEAPKTRLFAAKIKGMGYESVLVVTEMVDDNLYLAARNLPNVEVVRVQQADPLALVRYPKVLVTKSAIAKFEELLG